MSDFYNTDLGVSALTQTQCDEIALEKAGVVGHIGYGYAVRESLPEVVGGDWRPRWVATGGMGNCGTLVLLPASPRSYEVFREGRINALEEALDLSRPQAEDLFDACKGVDWSSEARVQRAALQLAEEYAHTLSAFPGVGNGAARWLKNWGVDLDVSLSMPRLGAAVEVARRLGRIERF